MELAKILVSGVEARVVELKAIPAGIIGATVGFVYEDPVWSGLKKNAVFVGAKTVVVTDVEDEAQIPSEAVANPGSLLKVGVFGTDTDKNLAIPTLYANLGQISPAADPSADASAEASLPVWAQLMERIERMEQGTGGFIIDDDGYILL